MIRSCDTPAIWNGFVVHTSAAGPTHENGMFGSTPTIVCGKPPSVMLRPITSGSPPIRLRQKFSVTIATSAVSSSLGKKVRPRIGRTPSTSK